MRPIDLSRMMQALAANLLNDRAVHLAQVQLESLFVGAQSLVLPKCVLSHRLCSICFANLRSELANKYSDKTLQKQITMSIKKSFVKL